MQIAEQSKMTAAILIVEDGFACRSFSKDSMPRSGNGSMVPRLASLCLLSAASLLGRPAFAAFSQASQSVAAQALGGAWVAKADDSSALFINPAGLSQLAQAEASFMYGKPLAGLPGVSLQQEYLVLAVPASPRLTLSAGASAFDASGLLKEYEALLGGAFQLNDLLALGLNASYLSHSYNVSGDALAAQDPVFANGRSKGAIGVDFGALAAPTERVSLGLSGRHLNKPDVGLASRDPVPMELRGGGLYRLERFSLLADLSLRDAGSGVSEGRQVGWGVGGEWKALETRRSAALNLRAGLNRQQLTAGFGFSMGALKLDYAMALVNNLMGDGFGTHRLALGFRFGGRPDGRLEAAQVRPAPAGGRGAGMDVMTIYKQFGLLQ